MTSTATKRAAGDGNPRDPAAPGPPRHRTKAVATALLVTGMASFGSATPVAKIVGQGFPVWLGSGLRMALATLVLVPAAVLAARRQDRPGLLATMRRSSAPDRWRLAAIALVGTFGFTVLMLFGMRQAPGAVAAVVMAATPAVTAIGSVVFLGDSLGWARIAALGLAVAGIIVVNLGTDAQQGSGDHVVLGSALVFGAVICEAAYSLLGKRLSQEWAPTEIAAVASIGAVVAFVPFTAWELWAGATVDADGGQWLAVLWWGIGTMALGSILWFAGMARVAATYAAAFMAVMPVSALLLSYVLLGEAFQWVHLVGIACVLAGLVIVVRSGATVH